MLLRLHGRADTMFLSSLYMACVYKNLRYLVQARAVSYNVHTDRVSIDRLLPPPPPPSTNGANIDHSQSRDARRRGRGRLISIDYYSP